MIKITPIKNDQWFHSLVLITWLSNLSSIFSSTRKLTIAYIADQAILNVYMSKITIPKNSL